jgi:hypothetical protein
MMKATLRRVHAVVRRGVLVPFQNSSFRVVSSATLGGAASSAVSWPGGLKSLTGTL